MSYNYDFNANDVGIRIKNARNAKGWSQAELAEKLETTSQNISKFEKSGLSDMNWIASIGKILDVDLLEDSKDVEGPVGELGKEILYQLIRNNGSCEIDELTNYCMYGLSPAQVADEIVKLSKIGLIVRELYSDFEDEDVDKIFIRAKGLIALKNMQLNTMQSIEINSKLNWRFVNDEYGNTKEIPPEVRSYEELIGNFKSYEDFVTYHKENDIETKVRNLGILPLSESNYPYRSFLINYLKNRYQEDYSSNEDWLELPAGKSFYAECITRMLFDVSNEKIKGIYDAIDGKHESGTAWHNLDCIQNPLMDIEESNMDFGYHCWELYHDIDLDPDNFDKGNYEDEDFEDFNPFQDECDEYYMNLAAFREKYSIKEDDPAKIFNNFDEIIHLIEDDEEREYFTLLRDAWPTIKEWEKASFYSKSEEESTLDFYPYKTYEEEMEKHTDKRPSTWFTKDEIADFINQNFKPAETEEEKEVDLHLKDVLALVPDALEYYFRFPKSWEENGLADLVRRNSGLF